MENKHVDGRDGEQYIILKTEQRDDDLPQLNRYEVQRVRDGVKISNFPAYLLVNQ